MKKMRRIIYLLAITLILSGCSVTRKFHIYSEPENAKVYFRQSQYYYRIQFSTWEYVGQTPLTLSVKFPNKRSYSRFKIEKKYYKPHYFRVYPYYDDDKEINLKLTKKPSKNRHGKKYRSYNNRIDKDPNSSGLVDWGPLGDTDQEAAETLNNFFDNY